MPKKLPQDIIDSIILQSDRATVSKIEDIVGP